MSKLVIKVFTLVLLLQFGDAARIFAWFPTPSISHQVVFRPLTQELARRGHEVVVVTTDPAFPKGQTPANLTEIDLHDLSYGTWRETFVARQHEMTDDLAVQMNMLLDASTVVYKKQMETKELRDIINGHEKYDLMIFEAVAFAALALKQVIDAPVVMITIPPTYTGTSAK